MQLIDILVPQLGEGLQEARIVKFLKEPGETVQRDEPIYQIETDKAVMEIESPHTGILQEWLVNEEEVIPVGSPIARLSPEFARGKRGRGAREHPLYAAKSAACSPPVPEPAEERRLVIPPRTRAYCRQAGISPDEMERIAAQHGKKLMPSDVDRYLAARSEAVSTSGDQDHLLTSQQRILVHRLKRSAQVVMPATLTYQLDWQALKDTQKKLGEAYPETYPSEFETLAYSVAQATMNYPKFRSTLVADDMVREYEHLNLGVAVHCPNDELVTAVISNADTLDFPDFVRVARQQVSAALNGDDQATESTQFLLTYMVDYQIVAANPILVAPAIGILFVGTPYPQGDGLRSNLTITFDHRLINGVVAANFTKAIAQQLSLMLSDEQAEQKQPDRVTFSRSALLAIPATQRYQQLSKYILTDVAQLLDLAATELESEIPLRELGISSRLSVELANTLGKRFGVEFAATLVWNYPTINALIGHVADKLEIPLEIPSKKSKSITKESPVHTSREEEIAALSDDDVTLLLEQKLAALGIG